MYRNLILSNIILNYIRRECIINNRLTDVFQSDVGFTQSMEQLYPGIIDGVKPGKRGAFSRKAPTVDVTWNHDAYRKGVLQLVPREQHQAKGLI